MLYVRTSVPQHQTCDHVPLRGRNEARNTAEEVCTVGDRDIALDPS